MTKTLLLGLAAFTALSASAQSAPATVTLGAERYTSPLSVAQPCAARVQAPAAGARVLKHIDRPAATNSALLRAPHLLAHRAAHRAATLPEGACLFEDFEAWDGQTPGWVPEGWTVESHSGSTLTANQTWGPSANSPLLPPTPDGKYSYGVSFATEAQDEWLISPEVTLPENQNLSFLGFIDPVFLFNLAYVDWETGVFSQYEVAATMKIQLKVDDGEWTEIWDASTPYVGMNINDLFTLSPQSYEEFNLSLSDYAGKKVRIAFQYVGIDGNTMFIDAIKVGFPQLDNVAYTSPLSTLYWGFTNEPGWPSLQASIALYPALEPLTWTNTMAYPDASYHWDYCDGVTAEWVTSDNAESLTETYLPDYSSPATTKNNFFYPPILTGSLPGATDGKYQAPYLFFQAGGTAERTLNDGSEFLAGLLPFDYNKDGLTYLTVEGDFGQMDTPITGYNSETDKFWYNYTFPGEDNPDYDAYIDGILNFIYPCATPLVVDGAHVLARGKDIDPEVELTLSIIALNENSELIPEENTITSTTLKASDFTVYDADASLLYYTLNFNFAEPIALDDSHPGYVVMLTGFHDQRVGYFAPMQSAVPNAEGLCYGWLVKKTKYESETYRQSFTPLAYITGPYGDCYNAFAINLKAHYGWLNAALDEVTVPSDGSAVNVVIDTYFPEDRISVSELAGVTTEYSGRYNKGLLTLRRDPEVANPAAGIVTVSTTGHSADIKVNFESAGLNGITVGSEAEIEAIYTPAGVKMAPDAQLAPGVYIVRRTDGTTSKIVR